MLSNEDAAPGNCSGTLSKSHRDCNEYCKVATELESPRLMFGKFSDDGQPEGLSLQGFDHQHHPDHYRPQYQHHRDQPNQKMAQHWNDEQDKPDQLERYAHQESRHPQKNRLEGMETYESILVVGIQQQENHRRNEREIGQRASPAFRKDSHLAACSHLRIHRTSAARTKGGRIGHLRGALRTGKRHGLAAIAVAHLIKSKRRAANLQGTKLAD